ncbi:MAG: citrate/2-methylcitrate synthase [Candidatus Omnitrophica bacterium]|nr:citrate/2-methylcitrate synthase [Candidatus Omnitrophota bacterium]
MVSKTKEITTLIKNAKKEARAEVKKTPQEEAPYTGPVKWPVNCIVGPGLEGAIACESKIGYVNGSKGELIYRGYDIFDLCAHSSFEEVSYLLLHGELPTGKQHERFSSQLLHCRRVPQTIRTLMGFPVEKMNAMAALRLGTNLMRQESTYVDQEAYRPDRFPSISADEDSIPMETRPRGEKHAIYEFKEKKGGSKPKEVDKKYGPPVGFTPTYRLISGVATIAGAVERIRRGALPLEPDPDLSHAGNLVYMITGRRPTPIEERIMDVTLILHADHGMNASTFATMVVASTLSDMYLAVGSGIAALNGPLHGGANAEVLKMLREIDDPKKAKGWFEQTCEKKKKIMGFGHRVYKAYDPRARVLGPLAEYLVENRGSDEIKRLYATAKELEKLAIARLGETKGIFPNVDFYSGIVYSCLGIPVEMFTALFAVSRVAGWTSRVMEYLENNRIFRPRAVYAGSFGKKYVPVAKREE